MFKPTQHSLMHSNSSLGQTSSPIMATRLLNMLSRPSFLTSSNLSFVGIARFRTAIPLIAGMEYYISLALNI